MGLLDPLFSTSALSRIFSDRGRLQGMLDFEAALARVQARADMIPAAAAPPIVAHCRAELYDIDELGQAAAMAGNPVIPMIQALTARVQSASPEAARHVHAGATSQDAMDTGLMLQLREALALIDGDVLRIETALAQLAEAHKRTVMAGRTWLAQAQPITFGLKAAGWLDAIHRGRARVRAARETGLAVQLGGAVGTLAAYGARGIELVEALADELELAAPRLPWHAQRDRPAELAAALGLLVGSMGKIARDLSLMMQTEVAEAFEPSATGRGGSSAMPHKHNPVGAAVVLAAARRVPPLVSVMLSAMVQEHERGLGSWQAEWATLPEICVLTGGAAAHLANVLDGLGVDAARMRENLEATAGQIYSGAVAAALAAYVGGRAAHQRVEEACRRAAVQGRHLREVVGEDIAELSPAELDRLFDPLQAAGLAEAFVDCVLAEVAEKT